MIPSKQENEAGLHRRYDVRKADGTQTDPMAEYFVLRLDEVGKNPTHTSASRKALMTYANEIEAHQPQLAADLRARYAP